MKRLAVFLVGLTFSMFFVNKLQRRFKRIEFGF